MDHQNSMVQSVCKMVINSLFFIQLCNFVDRGVKVSKFQNCKDFCPVVCMAQYRAVILTVFSWYFGRNDDFINSFWNLLTFSEVRSAFCRFLCSSASQMTKVKYRYLCVYFFFIAFNEFFECKDVWTNA